MHARLLATLLSASLLTMAPLAQAAPRTVEQAATAPKKKGTAPKFIPSASQENPRERERRLLRECKGRPNAGACLGYAN